MDGAFRGLRVLAAMFMAGVISCVVPDAYGAATAAGDSMRTSVSSMGIYVAGGDAALVDPRGRINRGGPTPLSQIPNCSRIEGSARGVHGREAAQASKVQLDLLSPQLGSYRIAVEAKSRFLLVQVSGSSGGVRCVGSDHVIGKLGKTYVWVVRWSVNKTDGKCALSIKRASKLKPDPVAPRPH
jgi:hypothetical protein